MAEMVVFAFDVELIFEMAFAEFVDEFEDDFRAFLLFDQRMVLAADDFRQLPGQEISCKRKDDREYENDPQAGEYINEIGYCPIRFVKGLRIHTEKDYDQRQEDAEKKTPHRIGCDDPFDFYFFH